MATIDPFKETISEHLKEVAQNDPLFAETLKKPNKSIDGCVAYIYSEVKKTKRCGFKDEEIYSMAIHYYDEDSIKEEDSTNQNVKVTQMPEPKKPIVSTPKPISREAKKESKQQQKALQGTFQFD